jgi:hypothetical protein
MAKLNSIGERMRKEKSFNVHSKVDSANGILKETRNALLYLNIQTFKISALQTYYTEFMRQVRYFGKNNCKVHRCTGIEALYRPYCL